MTDQLQCCSIPVLPVVTLIDITLQSTLSPALVDHIVGCNTVMFDFAVSVLSPLTALHASLVVKFVQHKLLLICSYFYY